MLVVVEAITDKFRKARTVATSASALGGPAALTLS